MELKWGFAACTNVWYFVSWASSKPTSYWDYFCFLNLTHAHFFNNSRLFWFHYLSCISLSSSQPRKQRVGCRSFDRGEQSHRNISAVIWETRTQRGLPLLISLPERPQWLELHRAESRSASWVAGTQTLTCGCWLQGSAWIKTGLESQTGHLGYSFPDPKYSDTVASVSTGILSSR